MSLQPLPNAPHLHIDVPTFKPPSKEPPAFGHACRELFAFKDGYRAMNHGACGSCPKAVLEAFIEWNWIGESNTDIFYTMQYQKQLNHVRGRIAAELLHADPQDVVFVLNATLALNSVLRSIYWESGDVIIAFNTVYSAIGATIKWLLDANPGLELETIDIAYPTSDASVLERTEECIKRIKKSGKKPKLCLFDAISSWPGVTVPWEKLVNLFKKYEVLSCVDAAHAIGQIPLNLDQTRPDFFVSNCHKWLYAHRSVAILYVDKGVQSMVQAVPTNASYLQKGKQYQPSAFFSTDSSFVTSFEWPGTMDLSNYFSVDVAIDFRQWLGGEEKINAYCHKLAKDGGRKVAEILGTMTMEVSDEREQTELVANMVTVKLPEAKGKLKDSWNDAIRRELATHYNTYVPVFRHDGSWWTRISAQIFLDMSDFVFLGDALKKVCEQLSAM